MMALDGDGLAQDDAVALAWFVGSAKAARAGLTLVGAEGEGGGEGGGGGEGEAGGGGGVGGQGEGAGGGGGEGEGGGATTAADALAAHEYRFYAPPSSAQSRAQAAERCYALLKQLKHDADESIADLGGVQPSMYRNA
jgi:hypothetical protein